MGNRSVMIVLLSATLGAAEPQGEAIKVSGSVRCAKPDKEYSLPVGDEPGHAFSISQSKCTWIRPLVLAGIQTKEDAFTSFDDVRGAKVRGKGIGVGTMTNGDTFVVQTEANSVVKDGVPQIAEGKWKFDGGTGKLKGLKGSGTYVCKGGAEGLVCDVEGEHRLAK